jgi:hypothetical protein
MNVVTRVLRAAINEAVKPKTFVKGDEFEAYLRRVIFPASRYDLVDRSHSYTANREDFIERSKEPDFRFRNRASGTEFYVEAKYRSVFYRQGIDWCQYYQLQRYHAIDAETPVYAALGVAGTPSSPEYLFLFPVRRTQYTRLFPSFLKTFEIPHSCLSPERLALAMD